MTAMGRPEWKGHLSLVLSTLILVSLFINVPPGIEEIAFEPRQSDGRSSDDSGIGLVVTLRSAEDGSPIEATNATVRIVDGWSGLDRDDVGEVNASNASYTGLVPGSVRLEVTAPGFASAHPDALLLGGSDGNVSSHSVVVDMVSLNASFTLKADSGASAGLASVTLWLDDHAVPMAGSIAEESDGNASVVAPANSTGWLHVNGSTGSRIVRWDGNASNETLTVDLSGSLRLFAPDANGSGTVLARHSPSGWSMVINRQGGLDSPLPRIDAGTWYLHHLVDGVPIGPDETRVDGPFWDLENWVDAGPDPSSVEAIEVPAATLDLSAGEIGSGTVLNGTWSAEWTLPAHQGTPLLPTDSAGVRAQIDRWLGNRDGTLSSAEANDFAAFLSSHGWRDSESAGCCVYDHSPLTSDTPVYPTGISVEGLGSSTKESGHSWGWSENADLIGQGDGRTSRLLWFPIIGHAREAAPLKVVLPEPWEVRYGPQLSLLTGDPDEFVVDRGATAVATDLRFTLGQNQPPSISVDIEDGTERFLPLSHRANLTMTCSDSSIGDLDLEWRVAAGGVSLALEEGASLLTSGEELGLAHGGKATFSATCTDHQGEIDGWNSTIEVDGEAPILQWTALEDGLALGPMIDAKRGDDRLEISSTSHLAFDAWGNDSSGEPVLITLSSNRTDDWGHTYEDHLQIADLWPQGSHINGLHLPIDDRHRAKPETTYWVRIEAVDSVGNSVIENRTLTLTDGVGPVPRPALTVEGKLYGPQTFPTPGSNVTVNLSQSYDDLSAIEEVVWSAWIDEIALFENSSWEEARGFDLPAMAIGRHQLSVIGIDPSGNGGLHEAEVQVWPQQDPYPRIVEVRFAEPTEGGAPATLLVAMENGGRADATGTICVADVCGAPFALEGGTVDGPGLANASLSMAAVDVGPIEVELRWNANDASSNGTVSGFGPTVQPAWLGPIRLLIWAGLAIGVVAWAFERRFSL